MRFIQTSQCKYKSQRPYAKRQIYQSRENNLPALILILGYLDLSPLRPSVIAHGTSMSLIRAK